MPVSPARAAAFDILLRVERDASFSSELLHSTQYNQLSAADHGLMTGIVMGVLRWRSSLDAEIDEASSQPLSKLDFEVLLALRMALYQIRRLERVPHRAALYESVELVKRARKRSAVPFVNAVLRKLSTRPSSRNAIDEGEPSAATLASKYAHPEWLVKRWVQEFGFSNAERICANDQSVPSTSIRVRTPEADQELASEGVRLAAGAFFMTAHTVAAGNVPSTKAFRERKLVIQDEGSQLVASLVGDELREGSNVLDCCAAPGGKSLAIADWNPSSSITAVEIYPHRARLMRELLQGAVSQISVMVADARTLPFTDSFERILSDVPCSGTGTLARNPEIKWRLRMENILELQKLQISILHSALQCLKPGGQLIYSTCSLEREENEDVVEEVIRGRNTIRVIDCAERLKQLSRKGHLVSESLSNLTRGPYLRTIPGVHPCDGFFAAILKRA